MRAVINKLFLITLCGLVSIIHPHAIADTTVNAAPEIIKTSNNIIKQHQKISRESTVKVVGMEGGHGSGAYVKINGQYFIITAKHVVRDDWLYYIEGNKKESVVGQVVYRSERKDIALLKIPKIRSRKAANLKTTEQHDLRVGDEVVYSGYPSSYELLTSSGNVSGYETWGESVLVQGWAWPGSSGSAVFNEEGNVVGLVIAVGRERFRSTPMLIETLVYIVTIDKEEMDAIKRISKK